MKKANSDKEAQELFPTKRGKIEYQFILIFHLPFPTSHIGVTAKEKGDVVYYMIPEK